MTTGTINPARPAEQSARPALSRAKLADNVDVVIETFLGGANMTIGELNALNADDVVTLDCPLNALVELRVNGVPIGCGELVAVGDKFGVRITMLAP
ncbi:MAG TPA: FliM/FliN family flagellar motor switch protein [Vitreimonas sp.]|uniref:FliM/FliN family flagellar motor switch protein n=1 Tax=Vitreimonas sp. TaxID=3069702 RepID=UPI002D455AE6|nr:FliM/FliN family flagellar motor switch protein [Vitreimonas sp.]HYD85996.1 FliM/FliN family flagellar motor switch protein [Vitreimonas sp.]